MITCKEATELVTEYFEKSLSPWKRLSFKMHIAMCPNCKTHLDKMEQLIKSMGHIPDDTEVPEEMLRRLAGIFSK